MHSGALVLSTWCKKYDQIVHLETTYMFIPVLAIEPEQIRPPNHQTCGVLYDQTSPLFNYDKKMNKVKGNHGVKKH